MPSASSAPWDEVFCSLAQCGEAAVDGEELVAHAPTFALIVDCSQPVLDVRQPVQVERASAGRLQGSALLLGPLCGAEVDVVDAAPGGHGCWPAAAGKCGCTVEALQAIHRG